MQELLPEFVVFEFGGQITTGENFTITIDNHTASITSEFGESPAELGERLATAFDGVANTSYPATYDIQTTGRELRIARFNNEQLINSTLNINTKRHGWGTITPQVVIAADTNWGNPRTVLVRAVNDSIIDGSEALAFPNLSGTSSSIRGPLTVRGGIHTGDDRYLNNPVMLPQETNLQLADGFVLDNNAENINGTAYDVVTDLSANHINPDVGERPGFDPRMNDYRYSFIFLNNDECIDSSSQDLNAAVIDESGDVFEPEVSWVSSNILSFGDNETEMSIDFTINENVPDGSDILISGKPHNLYQTPINNNNQEYRSSHEWRETILEFNSLPTVSSNTITLKFKLDNNSDGSPDTEITTTEYQLSENTETSALVTELANAVNALATEQVVAEARIGLLGQSRLHIRSNNLTANLGGNFEFTLITDLAAEHLPLVSGIMTAEQASSNGLKWLQAAIINLSDATLNKDWSLTLTPTGKASTTLSTTKATAEEISKALAHQLSEQKATFDYKPHISGSKVRFNTEVISECITPNDGYYYAPYNPNLDVDESLQIDRLIIDNQRSIGGDTGVISANLISGLGISEGTTIGGRFISGGINHFDLEEIELLMGKGNDTLTIDSSIMGITTINTGDGNDQITVNRSFGHLNISTEKGDDQVNIGNQRQSSQSLAGVITLNMGDEGTDNDVVTIDNSAVELTTATTITSQSIEGLGLPKLPEIQLLEIRAAEGTYNLHASQPWPDDKSTPFNCSANNNITLQKTSDGFLGTSFSIASKSGDYEHGSSPNDSLFQDKIACITGIKPEHLEVTEIQQNGLTLYELIFTNIESGVNHEAIVWADERDQAFLLPYNNSTIDVRSTTIQHGTTTPSLPIHQTITVPANSTADSTFAIRLPNLTPPTLTNQTTRAIPFNASAKDLYLAMDPILNPNNYIEDGSQPYTNNLVVTKRDNVFHLFFRGEHKNLEIQPEDITISPGATGLELSTTLGSIGYYGVNKLDIDFGNGADTVNIQGTSANTTLKLNDGNDNIFISSKADFTTEQASDTTYLEGNLNELNSHLQIDAGSGTQRLLISDASEAAGRNILITDLYNNAHSHAQSTNDVVPDGYDAYFIGIANKPISVSASNGGDFMLGTSIWTGWGDDTISIEGLSIDGNELKSITSINTGLGDDKITANVSNNSDGLLIVNSQGPFSHTLNMNEQTDAEPIKLSDLEQGNHRVPADAVSITITDSNNNSTTLNPNQFSIDHTLNRINLFAHSLPRDFTTIASTVTRKFALDGLAHSSITTNHTERSIAVPFEILADDIVELHIDNQPV